MTQKDCATSIPRAVVGADRWEEVTEQDGTHTIQLLGSRYEVIGRMGTSYASSINDLVMVNLLSFPSDLQTSGRLYVDGPTPESVFSGIKDNADRFQVVLPERMSTPPDAVQALMGFGIGALHANWRASYLTVLIAIMLLSCAILIAGWIRRKTRAIAILRLVGVSNMRICGQILREFLVLSFTGIAISLCVMSTLIQLRLFQTDTNMIRQGLWTGVFSLAAGLCVTVPALLHVTRVDVVKILR